ncbi:MAG TPA: dTDP-4-dehydrorhamnose reductase [Bacteroidales bacterium]|nr:dTDP-4-dehydrorhamnose reductase [Bacteroidales bacterium]
MTSILVTGGDGQLGSELKNLADRFPALKLTFTDLNSLDITDFKSVESFLDRERPSYVINAAGYTAVDMAEKETEKAFEVNFGGTANLVSALSIYGGKLIQISTDYIFDGESSEPYPEDYQPVPLSIYGKSKLAGEEIALACEKSMVIRTSWLYSSFGSNFVKTVIRVAKEKGTLRIVDDQTGSPTYAADLAEVIVNVITADIEANVLFEGGIYNFSNEGECSWYQFALAIKDYLDLDVSIVPVSTGEYPLPARRPKYSVLNTYKIKNKYSVVIPRWEESLAKCLKILKNTKQ